MNTLWLNEELAVTIGETVCFEQGGKRFTPSDYELTIWWPASFQYQRRRLGAFYFSNPGEEYASRAWHVIEEGLLATLDSLLNSYAASILAANKVYAMDAAIKAGIPVPASSIGNVSSLPSPSTKRAVIKTITDTMDIDETQKILTTEVPIASLNGDVEAIPAFFQERIDFDLEIRAYYFDGNTISIGLRWPPGAESLSDIRLLKPENVQMAAVDHPDARRYTDLLAKRLGLRMFCADYLVDRAGKTHLIDVNPHGSWHWLEVSVRNVLDDQFAAMIRRIVARD